MEDDKIFYKAGDLVTLRQELPNKPVMIVVRKEANIYKNQDGEPSFKGMRCRWFTTSGELQESVFNTKDLIKL